ncbi:translation initiation factor IF-2-like [Panthera leo]|uniref:translation initiation factor IF-2-like n=1 Tax=Panthera leo TaxID=9689 RepID=UPI001C69872E|nr:translation initiation factor IF-2-like [Panthera leo]XP_042767258.1 translation initiation factor IF-2-like [Panthera leo]
MFQSSRPPPHVHPAPAGPSRPRKPVLPRRRRGPRLRDGGGEAGAGVPASVRAAPHRVGDPSRPERRDATPAAEPEPRRRGVGGAAARGPRLGARLPALARLPTRNGARGRPTGGGGWTATSPWQPCGASRGT